MLKTVGVLFDEEPDQWGLRGDPYLWKAMRAYFEPTRLPASSDELVWLIEAAFSSLTGHSISEQNMFFVESFAHGGMSSGFVSPEYWRNEVIPMIKARFSGK